MTEWTPEAKARYHDEMQRLRASGSVSDHADTIRRRAEQALRTPDLEWACDLVHGLANDVLALLAWLQQAQEERDGAIRTLRMATTIHERTADQRQQAIDALREISQARSFRGPSVMGETVEGLAGFARAALVKLGEKP